MATAEELSSELNIKIIGAALVKNSVPLTMMLRDVMSRAAGYAGMAKNVEIFVAESAPDGSTMFNMHVEYISGGSIYIGALRRTPSSVTEYHS